MTLHPLEPPSLSDEELLRLACEAAESLIVAAQIASAPQCHVGCGGSCHSHDSHGDLCSSGLSGGVDGRMVCSTAWRHATIEAVTPMAAQIVRLELRLAPQPDGRRAAEFEPGQFMDLEIPGSGERRAYSLANTANAAGRLEFLIRLQPGGRFSGFLSERARTGMVLRVRGPMGSFGLQRSSPRPRWFVAGATGLSPMLAMLRRMVECGESHPARLFFGVNRESELFALDELQRLQAALPQLAVQLCVWQPEAGWQGYAGTPAQALRDALAQAPVAPEIYLCGPQPLIDAAERAAAAAGVPPAQVRSTAFVRS